MLGVPVGTEKNSTSNDEWVMIPDSTGKFYLANLKQLEKQFLLEPRLETRLSYRLYTRKNPTTRQKIVINDIDTLRNSNFNVDHPTRIILHGWMGNYKSPVNTMLRDAYLKRGDYNIIIPDWSSVAGTINYFAARNGVTEAGKKLALFIDFMVKDGGMPLETLYLIGHSLGAHLCGIAGKNIQSGQINTILGLDAALPLFNMKDSHLRLDSSDAEYVQTIHTDSGNLGFHQPLGDSAFYPNWGKNQPGCGLDLVGSCSHSRAYIYLAESISDSTFSSIKCKDFDEILSRSCRRDAQVIKLGGDPVNRDLKGVFYLPTNSKEPFGIGEF